MGSCDLDLRAQIDIASRLLSNQSLRSLNLDRPTLNTVQQGNLIDHLYNYLIKKNCTLNSLSLVSNSLFDEDALLLSKALFLNNSMDFLNLEANRIGVAGAEALASAVIHNGVHSLKELYLSNNIVSDDGAIALAEVSIVNFLYSTYFFLI